MWNCKTVPIGTINSYNINESQHSSVPIAVILIGIAHYLHSMKRRGVTWLHCTSCCDLIDGRCVPLNRCRRIAAAEKRRDTSRLMYSADETDWRVLSENWKNDIEYHYAKPRRQDQNQRSNLDSEIELKDIETKPLEERGSCCSQTICWVEFQAEKRILLYVAAGSNSWLEWTSAMKTNEDC